MSGWHVAFFFSIVVKTSLFLYAGENAARTINRGHWTLVCLGINAVRGGFLNLTIAHISLSGRPRQFEEQKAATRLHYRGGLQRWRIILGQEASWGLSQNVSEKKKKIWVIQIQKESFQGHTPLSIWKCLYESPVIGHAQAEKIKGKKTGQSTSTRVPACVTTLDVQCGIIHGYGYTSTNKKNGRMPFFLGTCRWM